MATSSCRLIRAGAAQRGLISPVLFILCMSDILEPSRLLCWWHCSSSNIQAAFISGQMSGGLFGWFGNFAPWLDDCDPMSGRMLPYFLHDVFRNFFDSAFSKKRCNRQKNQISGITLDWTHTWSSHIGQVIGKKHPRYSGYPVRFWISATVYPSEMHRRWMEAL